MASSTLNIRVSPRRMLSEREAAEYCGLMAKSFRMDCPVKPISLPGGRKQFDIQDLDQWLDGLKGGLAGDDDAILARLS